MQGSNSLVFKNPTLKSMIERFSTEAKKQFASYGTENAKIYNLSGNNSNREKEDKIENQDDTYNLNFTNNFFIERYKQFIPSREITPSEFEIPKNYKEEKVPKGDHKEIQNDLDAMIKNKHLTEKHKSYLMNFSFNQWLTLFLSKSKSIPVDVKRLSFNDKMEHVLNYFKDFTIKSNKKDILACEVISVVVIDLIKIITVQDIHKDKMKFLIHQNDLLMYNNPFLNKGNVLLITISDLNYISWDNEEKIYFINNSNLIK